SRLRGEAAQLCAEGQPQDVSRRDPLAAVRTRAPGSPGRDRRARTRGAENQDAGRQAGRTRARPRPDPHRGLRREARPRVAQPHECRRADRGEPRPGRARALPEGARDRRRAAHAGGEARMSTPSKDYLSTVVIAPHVSEKAARIATEGNQYVFRVRRTATKPEIRAAVEFLFEVKVDTVHVVNQPGK